MKVELEYVGENQPKGIVEVEESLMEALLETGNYVLPVKFEQKFKKVKKK